MDGVRLCLLYVRQDRRGMRDARHGLDFTASPYRTWHGMAPGVRSVMAGKQSGGERLTDGADWWRDYSGRTSTRAKSDRSWRMGQGDRTDRASCWDHGIAAPGVLCVVLEVRSMQHPVGSGMEEETLEEAGQKRLIEHGDPPRKGHDRQ